MAALAVAADTAGNCSAYIGPPSSSPSSKGRDTIGDCAALTDADTCLDALATYGTDGGAPHDNVKRRVVAVEQATSNALALVNRLQPPRRSVPLHQ